MKFWKKWPYWVKGGIAGLIISKVFYIAMLLTIKVDPCFFNSGGWKTIGKPCSRLEFLWTQYKDGVWLHYFITYVLPSILIFVVLGWLYGKIKSKKVDGRM